jgi:uncharacterized repeat protein (TIGR01451 family)
MSLSEIKSKLYKKNLDPDLIAHDKSEFDPKNEEADLDKWKKSEENDVWKEEAQIPGENKKKAFKITMIAISCVVAIAVILVAVYYVRNSLFNENNLVITMTGPTEARSGKPLTYEITYENKNIVSLGEAELRIIHPEDFKPDQSVSYQEESPTVSLIKIGKIDGKSGGKIIYGGKTYAPKGTLAYLKTELSYKPSNFNSTFVSKQQLGINVTSTPMTIEVQAPQDLADGDALDYQISYKNVGADDFENVRVKVDFPSGFIFSKSDPNPSEGSSVWYIGHLSAGESGKIVISGKLQGDRGNIKNFKAYIGAINQGQFESYNEETAATKIASSPLSISQIVNDSAVYYPNAGETLRFEIRYKNIGDLGLKNLIVTDKLDSPILDYGTVKFEGGGAYDTENQVFIWKSSDHAELADLEPGKEGGIRFTIKVKDLIPINTANDKNFVASSIAKIDSPDIPTPINMNKIVAGNRLDMKLNSKLLLDTTAFYADSSIGNSGPIPPAVGQETTYTIHLKAGNVSNDVTDAKVEIVLPTGVVATGKIFPTDAPVTYDERANRVVWSIGTIKAGEGILSPLREADFQLKVKPSPDQVGQSIDILKETVFSAKDSFTGENLLVKNANKTILIKEDNTVEPTGWKVVP